MGLFGCVIVGAVGWWKQDWLSEQYQWRIVMGPTVLSPEQERALAPKHEFSECARGCPTMVVLPAGSFMMGSPDGEKDRSDNEGPQHTVNFARRFALGKYPVTFSEWDACEEDAGACPPASDNEWGHGHQPVINVSWEHAKLYVAWLKRMTGKEYRLLSEAEWEYAARAGSATVYYWGDDIGIGNANRAGCGSQWDNKQTAPVGSFKPNAFGLHDMLGNVYQWVEDCYLDYRAEPSNGSPWTPEGCGQRVVRGGSYYLYAKDVRAAIRNSSAPGDRDPSLGFRVGRTLAP